MVSCKTEATDPSNILIGETSSFANIVYSFYGKVDSLT